MVACYQPGPSFEGPRLLQRLWQGLTEAFYGHYDLSDLEAAMEAFARRGSNDPN